jgi:TPR repeat protein
MRIRALVSIPIALLLSVSPVVAGEHFDQAIEALGDYNYPKAVPALRSAAQEGDRRAQEVLAFMLLHGEALYSGLTPDRDEALQWFGRAAANGSEVAQGLLRAWARRGHADARKALVAAGLQP